MLESLLCSHVPLSGDLRLLVVDLALMLIREEGSDPSLGS